MRILFFLFCTILIAGKGMGQSHTPDSLKQLLALHPLKDTTRVRILNQLAFYYSNNEPASGLLYADSALRTAVLTGDSAAMASSYDHKGLNEAALGKDSAAIVLYRKALEMATASGNKSREATVLYHMALSYFNLSDYASALEYQDRAMELYTALHNTQGIASVCNSKGVIALFRSDYPEALRNYLQALRLYEQIHSEKDMGRVFSNIALVYSHMENYDTSLIYHFKALDILKRSGELNSIQNTLANIGNTYDNAGKPYQALEYYHEALEINKKTGNKKGMASCLVNSGIVYYGLEDYGKALKNVKQALQLYEESGDKYAAGIAYSYLAGVYLKAPPAVLAREGVPYSGRYGKALALQQKGLQLAKEIGNLYSESEGWGNLSDIYSEQKDYAKALDAYKKHVQLRDSLFSQEKKVEISRMQMEYQFEKKEAALKAANEKKMALDAAEIKRQRQTKNMITTGAMLLLAMVVISFLLYKRKYMAEGKQREAELRAQMAEIEIKALRTQMNPHFIFNSLNSIGNYITRHEPAKADLYLAKFSKMIRLILEYSEHKEIPLSDDLHALELYMQLESMRMDHRFAYEIKIDEGIDAANTMVPPLILQPFVENSIWHGFGETKGAGRILIEIKRENDMIRCVVEDNGKGRPGNAAADSGKKSFGIRLTQSRIALMKGDHKEPFPVILSDLAQGVRVELQLPLVLNF